MIDRDPTPSRNSSGAHRDRPLRFTATHVRLGPYRAALPGLYCLCPKTFSSPEPHELVTQVHRGKRWEF